MLTIDVLMDEFYDESTSKIIKKKATLELEHSLVTLSKWEQEFKKPFLGRDEKTYEETIRYIKIMTVTPNVSPDVFLKLSQKNIDAIQEYISADMTATTFNVAPNQRPIQEIITAEIIYYWMIAHNIPPEYRHWHLSTLLALIRVCNVKNSPKKNMPRHERDAQRRSLNAERRARWGTRG